jgi:hypothetical protein
MKTEKPSTNENREIIGSRRGRLLN